MAQLGNQKFHTHFDDLLSLIHNKKTAMQTIQCAIVEDNGEANKSLRKVHRHFVNKIKAEKGNEIGVDKLPKNTT